MCEVSVVTQRERETPSRAGKEDCPGIAPSISCRGRTLMPQSEGALRTSSTQCPQGSLGEAPVSVLCWFPVIRRRERQKLGHLMWKLQLPGKWPKTSCQSQC